MQAPPGGDISKLMKGNRLQAVIKKGIRYGYLLRSFSTLDELSEDSDEKLFFLSRYNPNHACSSPPPPPT